MGLELSWGNKAAYLRAIDLVVQAPNDFYAALGKGVNYASKKYGEKNLQSSWEVWKFPVIIQGLETCLDLVWVSDIPILTMQATQQTRLHLTARFRMKKLLNI